VPAVAAAVGGSSGRAPGRQHHCPGALIMARKKKPLQERNEERRQEIKDANSELEMWRKAHTLPPAYLSVPELIRRIEIEVYIAEKFSDETIKDIANALSWYQSMVTVRPDWRKDSKDAQDELEVLADAARGMLDQFAAIRRSANMYLLPFPVTFSRLMDKRFGPADLRNRKTGSITSLLETYERCSRYWFWRAMNRQVSLKCRRFQAGQDLCLKSYYSSGLFTN